MQTESIVSKQTPAEFAAMKMKGQVIDPPVTPTIVTPTPESSTTVKPSIDDSTQKDKKAVIKNRSCFNCHKKGHVASCCPNKKGLTGHDIPSADNNSEQGSTKSSAPSQDSSEKKIEKGLQLGSGKGISFESTAVISKKFTNSTKVQFRAKTPNRLDRPRNISPREDSSGKSNRPDLRYTTLGRFNSLQDRKSVV